MPRIVILSIVVLAVWLPPVLAAQICNDNIPLTRPDSRYTDHGDGTVTDRVTGLMWDQCPWGRSGNDCTTGSAGTFDWQAALGVAETANAMGDGAGYKGYNDWRLPNIQELMSLVEAACYDPAINENYFPATESVTYRSSSPFASFASGAWLVNFNGGRDFWGDKDYAVRVRLVRAGQSLASFDATLDHRPDALGDYSPVTGVPTDTAAESVEAKTLSGLATVTGIKIEGDGNPQYRVSSDGGANWSDWTASPGVVADGDRIKVRLTASNIPVITRTATLTVGGEMARFSVMAGSAEGQLTPAALDFGTAVAGTYSGLRQVTLTSSGDVALTVGLVLPVGPFVIDTNHCSATLAPDADCTIDLRFAPTAEGPAEGMLYVLTNASDSPHGVMLTGTGTATPQPTLALSPTDIVFGSTTVGEQSDVQNVTLSNDGAETLNISAVQVVGDYAIAANDCGSTLAADASCTIGLRFVPVAAGTRSGALFVSSDADGSPHSVMLSGTGVAATPAPTTQPAVALSPDDLAFGSVTVGGQSGVQNMSLRNTGTAALVISGIQVVGDFTIASNTCGASLAVNASCAIGLRFVPAAAGARSGALFVSSNAPASPHGVMLSGTGVAAPANPSPQDPPTDGGGTDGGESDDGGTSDGGTSDGGSDSDDTAGQGGDEEQAGDGGSTDSGSGLSISGGCSISNGDSGTDPMLPLLVLASLSAVWRGRRVVQVR
jgi:hypothetical protein